MKLHNITLKRGELRAILDNNRDFIITELNDFKKGDLLTFDETELLFKIKDVITDEALKENYCILFIKELK